MYAPFPPLFLILSFQLADPLVLSHSLAEMSRDKAFLTLLSRTSPLRGRFTKEYLAHEELVLPPPEIGTRFWIMWRFQFHLYCREIFVSETAIYHFYAICAISPIHANWKFFITQICILSSLKRTVKNWFSKKFEIIFLFLQQQDSIWL